MTDFYLVTVHDHTIKIFPIEFAYLICQPAKSRKLSNAALGIYCYLIISQSLTKYHHRKARLLQKGLNPDTICSENLAGRKISSFKFSRKKFYYLCVACCHSIFRANIFCDKKGLFK